MTEILTSAQMRAAEQAAIDSGAVTGLALMERAGRGVVDAILNHWPEMGATPGHAVVLCGPGNNGGDGYVIARRLADRGWQVELLALGDPGKLPPDARENYDIWSNMGKVDALTHVTAAQGQRPSLVVDALFGTGLARPLDSQAARAIPDICARSGSVPCRVVAVDCVSGMDCDSGKILTAHGRPAPSGTPDLTVTFHRPKIGHILCDQPQKLDVVDIGLRDMPADSAELIDTAAVARLAPLLDKAGNAHKFDHGHALILTGGAGRTGAARLAARTALRIGAGLVTLGVPPSAQFEVASQITSLMLFRIATAVDLTETLTDPRITALCLGPGLGLDRALDLVPCALGHTGADPRPVVLDADALSAFQDNPDALFAQLHAGCVLTPHMGEFARLFPDIAADLSAPAHRGPAFSRVDAVRAAAIRAGCIVLLKGPITVIADAQGQCRVHAATGDRAAPWLATAGAGDVLAGMICGLMARGVAPMTAASLATWLHVDAARQVGPGLVADDLPEALPAVLAALLSNTHQTVRP